MARFQINKKNMQIVKKIWVLVFSLLASGGVAASGWPGVAFERAVLFLYNTQSRLSPPVAIMDTNGNLSETIVSAGVDLSASETAQVLQIANSAIFLKVNRLSKTFWPQHAVVFFNGQQPVASITFDFSGEGVGFFPKRHNNPSMAEYTDAQMNDFSAQLNRFKALFEQKAFPIHRTPFEYAVYDNQPITELALADNGVLQILNFKGKRFDLSGLALKNRQLFCVADKAENAFIYQLKPLNNTLIIEKEIPLNTSENIDFEGLAFNDTAFFIANEATSCFLTKAFDRPHAYATPLNWGSIGEDAQNWGNRGLEGIAVGANQIWLAKERQPQKIVTYDLKTTKLSHRFQYYFYKNTNKFDIADLFLREPFLYVLIRNSSQILRIDTRNGLMKTVSFKQTSYKQGQRLYQNKNSEYGMAEALLITDSQIWIGFDNNGDKVSTFGKEIGLKQGTAPAVLIFQKPVGF